MLAAKYDDGAGLVLAARLKDCGAFGCGATFDRFGDTICGVGAAFDRFGDTICGFGAAFDRFGEDTICGFGAAFDRFGDTICGFGAAFGKIRSMILPHVKIDG